MMYMTKAKYGWLIFAIVAIIVIGTFFVTSVVLADIHDVSLVNEWQTWFGIVKKATEIPSDEIVETANVVVFQPVKALIAC